MKIVDKITIGWERRLLVPGLDSRTFVRKFENWQDGHIFEETEEEKVQLIPYLFFLMIPRDDLWNNW